MAEQLSAEAQALVDEGMRLAKAYASAEIDCLSDVESDEKTYSQLESARNAESALRAQLERMAAMAAPQPASREPLSEERVMTLFYENITARNDSVIKFARAIEREIAQGEQP